jgi:hypothetical protein
VTPPILLLDVDGVLNALTDDSADLGAWDDWQQGTATAEGARWPILWSPGVISRLRELHESERVELRWLTTWGHDANNDLRLLVGLPELAVAGTYHDAGAPTVEPSTGPAHAAVAPAAPDPLTGRWWKYDVVARLVQQEPERRLIWVDDDLDRANGVFVDWATRQPSVTPIAPDPRCGLTPHDLDAIGDALD